MTLLPGHDEVVVERIGRAAPALAIFSLASVLSLPWAAGPIVPGHHIVALVAGAIFFVGGLVAGVYPWCVPSTATARAVGTTGLGVLVLEVICAWTLTG